MLGLLETIALAVLVPIASYGAFALVIFVVLSAWNKLTGRSRPQPQTIDSALRARLKRMARPTLLLTPTRSPGFSKVGGLPELPEASVWPQGRAGSLAFVAQIDIEAFRPHGGFDWLPEAGRLYLFYDDDRNGAADCGRAIYSVEPPGAPLPTPADLPKNRRFAERRVGFMRFTSLPSPDWLCDDEDYAGLDWETWPLAQDTDFGDEIEHRIGGYPSEIQSAQMAVDCEYLYRGLARDYREAVPETIQHAARQWRLLLQIDSDPALGMNWWDAGLLYVFIRARDAKRGDFSRTVTITQTH